MNDGGNGGVVHVKFWFASIILGFVCLGCQVYFYFLGLLDLLALIFFLVVIGGFETFLCYFPLRAFIDAIRENRKA